jgi:hypothetical protein
MDPHNNYTIGNLLEFCLLSEENKEDMIQGPFGSDMCA